MDEMKDFFTGSSSRRPEPRREEQAEPGGRSYNLPPLQPTTAQAQRTDPTPSAQANVPLTNPTSEHTNDRPQDDQAVGERGKYRWNTFPIRPSSPTDRIRLIASNPYSSTATNGNTNATMSLPICEGLAWGRFCPVIQANLELHYSIRTTLLRRI